MRTGSRTLRTFDARSREEWREWLARHHDSETEVWLVFHKRHTAHSSIVYDDAVDEALCFGWIDSLIKRLDEERYARKFTPRKADSRWSAANRKRYARLVAGGRLTPAGLKRAPADRSGDVARPSPSEVPQHIQKALRSRPAAWNFFEDLAPSYRRMYIAWIDSARRDATKEKRLREAVDLLAAGKKLGLR